MSRFTITSLFFLLGCLNSFAANTSWVGNIRGDGNFYLKAEIDFSAEKYKGVITLLKYDLKFPVQGNIEPGHKISFQIDFYSLDTLKFSAVVSNDQIEGEVKGRLISGNFWMRSYSPRFDKDFSTLVGYYQLPDNRKMLLTWGGDCRLSLIDFDNAADHSLMTLNDSVFFEWADSLNAQAFLKVTAKNNLVWFDGKKEIELKRIEPQYIQQRVKVVNKDIAFYGTLHYNQSENKLPLCIMINGSGGQDKDDFFYLEITDYFRSKGYAMFLYDKRGTGESNGSWHSASYEDLAGDIVKAITILKANSIVDNKKIVLFGFSQGAVIAPLVAARSADVEMVVSCMGSSTKTQDQEMYDLFTDCSRIKLDKTEETEIKNLYEKFFNYTRTGKDWLAYYNLAKNTVVKRWYLCAGIPPVAENDWRVLFWKANVKYDCTLFWRPVKAQSLLIYGDNDSKVPSTESVKNLDELIKNNKKNNIEVKVYPKLGHILRQEQLDYIASWLKAKSN